MVEIGSKLIKYPDNEYVDLNAHSSLFTDKTGQSLRYNNET